MDGGQVIHRFGEGAFEILRQGMTDGRNRENDGGERTDVIVLVYPLKCGLIGIWREPRMAGFGKIGDYVSAVASKTLSTVDIDPRRSNQHEFGGVGKAVATVLGTEDRKASDGHGIDTVAIYMDDGTEPLTADIRTSWYDARRQNPNRNAEWRLYYQPCAPLDAAQPGDTLHCGYMTDGRLMLLVTKAGSGVDSKIRWLFGIESTGVRFEVHDNGSRDVDVFSAQLLELLGFSPRSSDELLLDDMVSRWGYGFPAGREFARYAQDSLTDIDPKVDDPDRVVIAYYEREYHLFTVFEQAIIQHEYEAGPFVSADGRIDARLFTTFYTRARNRRMSRAGTSLEQHIERILIARGIRYAAQARTEGSKKPDFLFPSREAYLDPGYPSGSLRMLAAKTSTKDRWRQVLDEAGRIPDKHLFTIAPAGISVEQNAQMVAAHLHLVMPETIRDSHPDRVRGNTMLFRDFLDMVSRIPADGMALFD